LTSAPPTKIAVLGGGISGLAAAHRVVELRPEAQVTLLEASDRLGGVLQTERRDGFLVERAADMFITRDRWALDLCRRIGFEDQLIGTQPGKRQSFVVSKGKLVPIPEGFTLMSPARIWPVLTTPLFSPVGKLRMAWEFFTPPKASGDDESLASFAQRRFGREAYERLVQPLIGGIYTADPEKLSMAATMQQFVEMEREHGSLIRGMRRRAGKRKDEGTESGARYGLFVAPRDGMSSLIEAIAARLPEGSVRLSSRVERLSRSGDGWELSIAGQSSPQQFDAVIVATRAPLAAEVLRDVDSELADDLNQIPHAGAAVVVGAYRREQIEHPLDGFGFVVPMVEQRRILACSFTSNKFAGRAPEGSVLLRTFVGGACQPELMQQDDDAIRRLVSEELGELIGLSGEPLFSEVVRWSGAMPQYHVGHLDLVARIESRAKQLPNLELAGNAYHGVGIPFCVRSGESAAEAVLGGT
jgi:oxygen-dependent protoporphyrinogen oxidase